ncbi:MAG: glycosyltransferase [Xanthomonadaceae bacterium]|nr:glycosyltransferase [Xanthomonadaceae bacterium]
MPLIRIVGRDNGVGLSRDMQLLAEAVTAAGYGVEIVGLRGEKLINELRWLRLRLRHLLCGKVDVQIFVERVHPRYLPLARINLLIPNPEWFLPKWRRWLSRFDRILCKTHEAAAIFKRLGYRSEYVGFTSHDRSDVSVPRIPQFFHLAGRSSAKGTRTLVDAWSRHPEWPMLTVVQNPKKADPVPAANIDYRIGYLDDHELRRLQNAYLFHFCPSEVEGFGHYIVEGMSAGAIVAATDGAPMNELIQPGRGLLIPTMGSHPDNLGTRYRVDVSGIEDAVNAALSLSAAERETISAAAREFFIVQRRLFHERLTQVLQSVLREDPPNFEGDAVVTEDPPSERVR